MTQMDLSSILTQPWVIPSAAALAAFLLGFIIARVGGKGGASWFSALVFWPLRLVLEVLDSVHTARFKYYAQVLTLLCIEGFFAFRAATVYYEVLGPHMQPAEILIVSALVFCAIFLCGYMVATHPGKHRVIMAFVILHDIAGTLWISYVIPGSHDINTDGGFFKATLTAGMCGLSFIPFRMGKWIEELRPQLDAELAEEIESFTAQATHRIKRRAVDLVLKRAKRVEVVHLVRALPAVEFAEFKKFVMPIIAPGVSHNLDDMAESQHDIVSHDSRKDGDTKTAKMAAQKPATMTESQSTKRRETSRKPGGETTATSSDESRKPGGAKTARTTARDERIRQYAAAHPEMKQEKLKTHFKVSLRTIQRILAAQPSKQSQDASDLLENKSQAPSSNGHDQAHDPDTDKMEAVSFSEEDLEALQN